MNCHLQPAKCTIEQRSSVVRYLLGNFVAAPGGISMLLDRMWHDYKDNTTAETVTMITFKSILDQTFPLCEQKLKPMIVRGITMGVQVIVDRLKVTFSFSFYL